ncbi:alpha/beta hydrolase [Xenorhabdus sp. DI]|uniref:RBBP9/YdeN family alpha/beta hydrolase n=1 Tax=Xenorhabdus doucetiae TaxID=351671 RepID=UPI001997B51E|nr:MULTISPECIES: alpha/beta hydrolase [unclassified Xenorhabdus]MBD2784592.1 alpha/beta hydrolase [Xenorhabdus sp. 3]MBD2788311.1 alpha/beta hydrolase [Xenorhabdus sp. DI]MBD2796337.1 alpha/beta hydrolase [Xenorhabdus sp. 18]
MTAITYLIVPGYTNSGPDHWQSHLEKKYLNVVRVQQDDWQSPVREKWIHRLHETIDKIAGDIFLIGHSCGAVTITQWAAERKSDKIKGALLVAPADIDSLDAPLEIQVQRPLATSPLPFPSTLVCSDNDEFLPLEKAHTLANCWNSSLIVLSGAGHIHTAAGYGEWLAGEQLINEISNHGLITNQ